eukprot:SAG31_NODE_17189_length_679_cov_14.250000_1_plen_82_part_00
MIVNIPKIRGYLLAISTKFSRLSTDQSEKQEADLALPNLTDRMMALRLLRGSSINYLLHSCIVLRQLPFFKKVPIFKKVED